MDRLLPEEAYQQGLMMLAQSFDALCELVVEAVDRCERNDV